MIGERLVHESLGDLGEGQRRRHRMRAGVRAGDRAHAGKADPDGDGAPGAMFGAQPPGNAVGEMAEHRADEFGRDVATAERRLRADRSRATLRLHPTLVVVGRERADLGAERPTEQRLQRAVGRGRQLSDACGCRARRVAAG